MIILTACGQRGVPIVSPNGTNLIASDQYEEFIEKQIELAYRETAPRENHEVFLEYVTIGLSMDIRVGLFGWKKSLSNAVEFHMNQVREFDNSLYISPNDETSEVFYE